MITSNLVFSEWDKIFKDPLTTAAAIDRVVHHSIIIEFGRDIQSMRVEEAKPESVHLATRGRRRVTFHQGNIMAKMTPEIRDCFLFCYPDPMPVCPVDSPAWFAWLETAVVFRYCSGQRRNLFRGHGPFYEPVSFRKERRRQVGLWYAYRRVHGVLYKQYVGKSARLTEARLEETAVLLNEIW